MEERVGWIEIKVENIAELMRGITYKKDQASSTAKDNYKAILRSNNINGSLNLDSLVYIPNNLIKNEQFIKKGDILFAMSSGSKHLVGKSAQAKNDYGASYGAFCSLLRPFEGLSKEYVAHFFQATAFRKLISEIAKGTNINNLKREHILGFAFPLAPLPEQRAIVAKIERLFSELDDGITSLKKAQEQLKIYRQAVLYVAFNNPKFKEDTLDKIVEDHMIGLVRGLKDQHSEQMGVPYIKMNNIDLKGNVDVNDVVYVSASMSEIEKYNLKKFDLLVNTRNSFELVGKTGIVRVDDTTRIFNNNLLRLRVKKAHNALFVGYQLISPRVSHQMRKNKKATTNVCALYQRDIFPIRIRLTDKRNQDKVVQEIETRLSVCDNIEASIKEALFKAKALRQSILKKAFEGKLLDDQELEEVRRAPDWEPAEKLLERIKFNKDTAKQRRNIG